MRSPGFKLGKLGRIGNCAQGRHGHEWHAVCGAGSLRS